MQTSIHTASRTSRILIACLLGASLALGSYCFMLRSDLIALRGELARAQRERPAQRADLSSPSANPAPLLAKEDPAREAEPQPADRDEPVAAATPLDGFTQTLATPEMRQMIQREALGDARKEFADLLKHWNLPPAETDQFLQFVAERDSADSSDALAMLATGKLDAQSIAEQDARQEKTLREHNARLKALLGEERYAEFQAADARAAERKAVSTYRDHLEAAGAPLTDEQRAALAKIVVEEQPDENDWQPEDIEFFTQGMTDAQLLKLRQRQEAAHTRIAQQAASFLSPDQIAALQGAFRSELEELELGLKIARTLFQNAGK